jgi:hypothetical protein
MGTTIRHWLLAGAVLASMLSSAPAWRRPAGDRNDARTVVLIVTDGLRWQEVFTGADPTLLNEKDGGSWVAEEDLRKRYWRDDPRAPRSCCFRSCGERSRSRARYSATRHAGSIAQVTNGKAFSYPGYNEMTTGYPNDAIDSNEFGPNPNPSVFEWLNNQSEFRGQVAVYGTWNAFDRYSTRSAAIS